MYRCDDCGRFFEEPVEVHDDPSPKGVSLTSGYYIEWYCPHCGSDHIEEADTCALCGEPIAKHSVLCDNCKEDINSDIAELANSYHLEVDDMKLALEAVL